MKRTVFQHPELRDANDNIIQQGAFGKNTALANSTNDGWIDYVANDLEALYDNINGARIYVASKAKLPATGDLSAMYIAEDTGKWYLWDGTKYIETDNARKIADEAIAARDAAKASANDAANSAREQQADWNVTDTTNQAFIKNKPAVYPRAKTLEIEDTRAQINTPSFFINNYNRRIKSDFKIEDSPEAETFSSFITITPWDNNTGGYPSQLAFTAQGNIFYRIGSSNEKWGNWKRIPLEGETIARATADASGNVITTTYVKIQNNAGFHNSIFRGKSLGTSVTSAQRAAITAGTFDDMFVGDYWTINGVVWRIAGFDYWYNVGDTNNFTQHHVVIVPDTCLYNAQMHKTASGAYESGAVNTTEGGYLATDLYAELDTARNLVYAAFGQANVPTHRKLLPTSCTGGKYTSWAWKDSNVELMNEVMVYGTRAWGDSGNNGYSVGSQKTQLPLFRLSPRHINTRQTYWLMDVSSSTSFALVYDGGYANYRNASLPFGVRPAFALI